MSDKSSISWPPRSDSLHYDPVGYRKARIVVNVMYCVGIASSLIILLTLFSGDGEFLSILYSMIAIAIPNAGMGFFAKYCVDTHTSNISTARREEQKRTVQQTERALKDQAERSTKQTEELRMALEKAEKAIRENAYRTGNIIFNAPNNNLVIGNGTINAVNQINKDDAGLAEAAKNYWWTDRELQR